MDEMWDILGIGPTEDEGQIRRAYAEKSRSCNPEEDPQGFMALRQAYQAALEYARGGGAALGQTISIPQEGCESDGETSSLGVQFAFAQRPDPGENRFRDGEAFQRFVKLYQKENQKNWKLWMEYFVSPAFLAVSHQEDFCALLLEHVRAAAETVKPGPAFVNGLYIVYQLQNTHLTVDEKPFFAQQGGPSCPPALLELMGLLPDRKKPSGDDNAMLHAFQHYYQLWELAEDGSWGDEGLHTLREIMSAYQMVYIKEKIPTPSYMEPNAGAYLNHPLALRLFTDFVTRAQLPVEAYQIIWESLDLKSAQLGRAAVLMGPLRALCLDHAPGLAHQEKERFAEVRTIYLTKLKDTPEEVEAFLAREDVQRALVNRDFIENDVLKLWLHPAQPSPVLFQALYEFYRSHPQVPFSERLRQECMSQLHLLELMQCSQADEQDTSMLLSLSHRPFLRYWLNLAFPRFGMLSHTLARVLPPSSVWNDRLFEQRHTGEGKPVTPIVIELEGVSIRVILHRFYIAYELEGRELICPGIPISQLFTLGEVGLWLLPLALVGVEEEDSVRVGVARLLQGSALPQEQVEPVTQALVDGLYQWNQAGSLPPILAFRETEKELYGIEIVEESFYREEDENGEEVEEERLMASVFQVIEGMPRYFPDSFGPFDTLEEALEKGTALLEQIAAPPVLAYAPPGEREDRRIPTLVSCQPERAPVREWRPPAAILNRLWGRLSFWKNLRCIPQSLSDHLHDLENHWKGWKVEQGQKQPLTEQMGELCDYFRCEAEEREALIGPTSAAWHLERLLQVLETVETLPEDQRLQALLDTPDWAEGELSVDAPLVREDPTLRSGEIMSEQLIQIQGHYKQLHAPQNRGSQPLDQLRAAFLERVDRLLSALLFQVEKLRRQELDKLDESLAAFAEGKLERLEFSYEPKAVHLGSSRIDSYPPMYSLVFLRLGSRFVCLFFDDVRQFFHVLYREECPSSPQYINIGHDRPLPELCLFNSFFHLQCHLSDILDVVAQAQQGGKELKLTPMRDCAWARSWGGVYISVRQSKYNLGKLELGKFPLERATTPIETELSLPSFATVMDELGKPMELCCQKKDGEQEPPVILHKNQRYLFPRSMERFFAGELSSLRLSWTVLLPPYKAHFAPEFYEKKLEALNGRKPRCCLLLRRDGEKVMLLVLEDFSQQALYHVADRWTYMDVEGKKYPKDTFEGKTVPAYLIHKDLLELRSHLDLLLEHLDCPYTITRRFAEYADEKPVKARAYPVIRAEVLGEEA